MRGGAGPWGWAHIDLAMLFDTTASCLTSLTLTYGMKHVGMDYDKSLFGMKLSDCRSLAKAIERAETLICLNLSGNLLDDDKVRMVASGMVDNLSVVHLDLAGACMVPAARRRRTAHGFNGFPGFAQCTPRSVSALETTYI